MNVSMICAIIIIVLVLLTAISSCITVRVKGNRDASYYKVEYLLTALIVVIQALQVIGKELGW